MCPVFCASSWSLVDNHLLKSASSTERYPQLQTPDQQISFILFLSHPSTTLLIFICLQDSHTPAGEAERQKHSRDRGRGQGGSFGTIAANYLDGGDGRMCQTQSSDTRPNGEQTRSPEPKTPRPEWICQALKPLYIDIYI
jgi:hypothetical protein